MSHEGHDNFGQGAPPTVSHIEPARPVWPTVIGVISIVFGLLGALQGCGGIVMPFAMNGLTGLMPDDQSKAVFAGMSDHLAWGVAAGVTGMAVGVLLLTAGIGMVQRRRWSVRAHTIWAVLAILQSGVGGVYGFLIQQSQFQAMKAGGMPPTPPTRGVPVDWAWWCTRSSCCGGKPGLRAIRCHSRCPSSASSKAPCTKAACVHSLRKAGRWGGCSRVSATTTRAPWRMHQRAIARPEIPRPRIRTS